MAKKQVTIPVFHVFHNRDISIYNTTIREDKVYLDNSKVAEFANSGLFTLKDRRGKLGKKPFKALIYLDGKSYTSKVLSEDEKKKILDESLEHPEVLQEIPDAQTLFEPLTDKDRKTIVEREIAKQLGKFKPMDTWMFLILALLSGVSLALTLIGFIR